MNWEYLYRDQIFSEESSGHAESALELIRRGFRQPPENHYNRLSITRSLKAGAKWTWTETPEAGSNLSAGTDPHNIVNGADHMQRRPTRPALNHMSVMHIAVHSASNASLFALYPGENTTIHNTEIQEHQLERRPHRLRKKNHGQPYIDQNVTILSHEHNLPKGHKLILGDKATVTL